MSDKPESVSWEELRAISDLAPQFRRGIEQGKVEIQTYRVNVTLTCGHRHSWTIAARTYDKDPEAWRRRRFECRPCARADFQRRQNLKVQSID